MRSQRAGWKSAALRLSGLACAALIVAAGLAGCGASGSTSSSGSGDWFYHWNCNGDPECLATNPTGAPSGTSDEGPSESACTPLLQFAQNFWGSAAVDSCDQNPNGSAGGGGGGKPTISSFSPSASAPCTQVTLTGTNFPGTVTGVTVTIDGMTATVNAVTSTSITVTLPCTMSDFTGGFTVTTSGGSVTSGTTFQVVNHLYGVAVSSSQFVAVGGGGTILTSPDGTTWTAETSHVTTNLYAAAWSGSAFLAVGQNGTVLRSTDGVSWTSNGVPGNFTDFFAVNWNGSQFVIIGDSGAAFTSPDGITWTQRSLPISAVYGGLAWSGTGYVAVGGSLGSSPTILTSPDGVTWTHVTTTAANGNQLLAAAFGTGTFVALGDAETVITSPTGSTWTAQSESQVGNLQGVVWSGTQFVGVGFDTSATGSVIITSPNGTTWTGQSTAGANNRSLNAVTFGKSEYVAVGGYGTIITSLNGASWTNRRGF